MSYHPKQDLVDRIKAEIKQIGRITFARFMEQALYDPDLGYYNTAPFPMGFEGDYITSPEVHSVFGHALARQLIQMYRSFPDDVPLIFLEMGAGKGLLMKDILESVKRMDGKIFDRLSTVIVDRSPWMVSHQSQLLEQAGFSEKVIWEDSLRPVIDRGGMTGCILSNELVDAFPVHRTVMTETGLKEIFVTCSNRGFSELQGDPSTVEVQQYFDHRGIKLVPGQYAEVNLLAIQWMKEVGSVLKDGYALTFDYGHTAADLFSPHRMKGTLLCYYRHRVNERPYERIGEQDITTHVDFSALAEAGREVDLEVTGFTDQQYFLMSLGAAHEMEGMDPESKEFKSMKYLMSDSAMGHTLKLLIQHKNITPPELEGLSFKAFFKDALWR